MVMEELSLESDPEEDEMDDDFHSHSARKTPAQVGNGRTSSTSIMNTDQRPTQVTAQHEGFQNASFSAETIASITSTPIADKAAFDFDAPRSQQSSRRKQRNDSTLSTLRKEQRLLSKEQNAWAGIDEILENKSVDSYALSTADILPADIAQALKWEDDSQIHPGENSNHTASTYDLSAHKVRDPMRGRKATTKSRPNSQDGNAQLRTNLSNGGLFDILHWSEKDNVDENELRQRQKKLNQSPNRKNGKKKATFFFEGSVHSLPSLASIHDQDTLTGSIPPEQNRNLPIVVDNGNTPLMENMADQQLESVPEAFPNTFREGEASHESDESSHDLEGEGEDGSDLHHDGLKFDEKVDTLIKEMEKKVVGGRAEVVSEAGSDEVTSSKNPDDSMNHTHSTSGSSDFDKAAEDHFLDFVPSKTTQSSPMVTNRKSRPSSKDDKRDTRPSLRAQLKNSLLKLTARRKTEKPKNSGIASGNDARFFPKTQPEKFGSNRCLLNEGQDGVNWD